MSSKNNLRIPGRIFLSVLFVVICIINFIRIDSVSHSASDTLRPFIIQTAFLIILLLPVYYWLTRNKRLVTKK